MLSKTIAAAVAALFVVAAAARPAQAQGAAASPPQNVLDFTASASLEVNQDLLSISFTTAREGADAATVQTALKLALDAALAEARKAARPQQLDVRTGNFSLYPRYAPKGGINGWQGTAELVVQGRDMAAIASLSGRIRTMAVAGVEYGLSREARERAEAEVTMQAIARFRSKAVEMSRQFGFSDAGIREVTVSTSDSSTRPPMPMMRMREGVTAADAALPVEPGKGTVTATASGSVQMK